jgi:hypothetical protein
MSTKFTREHLHKIGYVPDGKGNYVKAETKPAKETNVWTAKPKLNSVETRFLKLLETRHPAACIIPQFRLRVGDITQDNPVHFTADFAVFHCAPQDTRFHNFWHCVLWEVKDKRRKGHSDELTRPKLVHKNNPFVASVMLAIWDGKSWEERRLSP